MSGQMVLDKQTSGKTHNELKVSKLAMFYVAKTVLNKLGMN